jgi:tetratricopeptide (TPR) repeat protein
MPTLPSQLTAEERVERHRLIVRDSVALSTLLAIAVTLTFVTYLLFHSFTEHRLELKQRWKKRGEIALANHQPLLAIESLRSALAYDADDRGLQIELATALAAAGRTQEAVVYFDTLHETEPGNGMINLQLARLAATQGNVAAAVDDYEAAVDGTWNGDGVVRRREVRLELARYLITQRRFDEARNQLLIAAGNAADNHKLQLTVAGLLEQAQGDADAYNLYRKAAAFRETRTAALIGAGRSAAALSRYLVARNMLQEATAQPDFNRLPDGERIAVRKRLDEAVAILDLYPAQNLPLHVQAVRAIRAVDIVRGQIAACSAAAPAPPPAQATAAKPAGALSSAISAVQRAGSTIAGVATGSRPPAPPQTQTLADQRVEALAARWSQLPADDLLERRMEHDPALLESTLQLVYEMEDSEAEVAEHLAHTSAGQVAGCVPPSPDAALLLKIAAAPDQIDQL